VHVSFFVDVTEYSTEDLLWIMLNGAGVQPCEELMGPRGEPDARYEAARLVAAAWLLDRDLPTAEGPKQSPEQQALAALRALPADEQRARVAAFRDAERTCAEGDRLEMLTGTSEAR
jgi:hypothetical protein